MYVAIKKTRVKIGRMVKKGSIGEASYKNPPNRGPIETVSYTHLRAHET